MTSDLLKEQDLRTSTQQRWRNEQLMASTILVWPSPLGQHLCIGFPLIGKIPEVV